MQTQLMLQSRATFMFADIVLDGHDLLLFPVTLNTFVSAASGLAFYFSKAQLRTTVESEPLKMSPIALYLSMTGLSVVMKLLQESGIGISAAFLEIIALMPQILMHRLHSQASDGMTWFLVLMGGYRFASEDQSLHSSHVLDDPLIVLQAILCFGVAMIPIGRRIVAAVAGVPAVHCTAAWNLLALWQSKLLCIALACGWTYHNDVLGFVLGNDGRYVLLLDTGDPHFHLVHDPDPLDLLL